MYLSIRVVLCIARMDSVVELKPPVCDALAHRLGSESLTVRLAIYIFVDGRLHTLLAQFVSHDWRRLQRSLPTK